MCECVILGVCVVGWLVGWLVDCVYLIVCGWPAWCVCVCPFVKMSDSVRVCVDVCVCLLVGVIPCLSAWLLVCVVCV